MLAHVQAVHLSLRYLATGLVVAVEQRCIDDKTGRGLRGAKKLEYGLVALERLAGPVFADLTEQAMLNGIPL